MKGYHNLTTFFSILADLPKISHLQHLSLKKILIKQYLEQKKWVDECTNAYNENSIYVG